MVREEGEKYSLVNCDDVMMFGVYPGQSEGEIVGFWAGIDEETDREWFREDAGQLSGADH